MASALRIAGEVAIPVPISAEIIASENDTTHLWIHILLTSEASDHSSGVGRCRYKKIVLARMAISKK